MTCGTIEIYRPRNVSHLCRLDIGGLTLKVYGLVAEDRKVDEAMMATARSLVRDDVLHA